MVILVWMDIHRYLMIEASSPITGTGGGRSKAVLIASINAVRDDFSSIVREKAAYDAFAAHLKFDRLDSILSLYKRVCPPFSFLEV